MVKCQECSQIALKFVTCYVHNTGNATCRLLVFCSFTTVSAFFVFESFKEVKLAVRRLPKVGAGTNYDLPVSRSVWHLYIIIVCKHWCLNTGLLFWNDYDVLTAATQTIQMEPTLICSTTIVSLRYLECISFCKLCGCLWYCKKYSNYILCMN